MLWILQILLYMIMCQCFKDNIGKQGGGGGGDIQFKYKV